ITTKRFADNQWNRIRPVTAFRTPDASDLVKLGIMYQKGVVAGRRIAPNLGLRLEQAPEQSLTDIQRIGTRDRRVGAVDEIDLAAATPELAVELLLLGQLGFSEKIAEIK